MSRTKKSKRSTKNKAQIREEYEDYLAKLYGLDFIAGYTEGGVPYGTFSEDKEENGEKKLNNNNYSDDEIPF